LFAGVACEIILNITYRLGIIFCDTVWAI